MSEFNQVVKQGTSFIKKRVRRFLLIVLSLVVLGGAAYLWVANWTYSKGTRAGYLVKISRKGVVFKTYEGQLNLGGVQTGKESSGIIGNIWDFSVRDKGFYEKLQQYEGKHVKLSYRQIYQNMPWQGKTDYFVYEVQLIE